MVQKRIDGKIVNIFASSFFFFFHIVYSSHTYTHCTERKSFISSEEVFIFHAYFNFFFSLSLLMRKLFSAIISSCPKGDRNALSKYCVNISSEKRTQQQQRHFPPPLSRYVFLPFFRS